MPKRTLVPLSSIRSVVVLLGAMLLALALVVLATGAASKPADAATQTITKVFDKPGTILIPAGAVPGNIFTCQTGETEGAASPYPSKRNVQAFPEGSTTLDVNLVLRSFWHSFPDEVDVLLSKGVRTRTVMSDAGGSDDVNGITLNLDDEAANGHLPDESQLVSGRFKPTNYVGDDGGLDDFPEPVPDFSPLSALSRFDGTNPNGLWKLRVNDDAAGDCGQFAGGWRLIIKARVPTS
jgi:hypothetical protein